MKSWRTPAVAAIFASLFIVGFVLMGFEMLGSRYLNPYFGGGITTWASLISVVLLAMMAGYLAGGMIVDAHPRIELFCLSIVLAGVLILTVPAFADALNAWIISNIGDGLIGVLLAALIMSFIPVALLSACSPFVVRFLLSDLKLGGRTTGTVYSVSTLGNVIGTLVTTFYLIPSYGTRAITLLLGGALVLLAALLYAARTLIWAEGDGRR